MTPPTLMYTLADFRFNVYSQIGENGIVEKIFDVNGTSERQARSGSSRTRDPDHPVSRERSPLCILHLSSVLECLLTVRPAELVTPHTCQTLSRPVC